MILPDFGALIFDCDGTLCLTADLHYTAQHAAFAAQGASLARDWYDDRAGLARIDLIAEFEALSGHRMDIDRLIAESIAQTLVHVRQSRENPPVAALARHWFGKVPMSVASNSEGVLVQAILANCAVAHLFDPIISLTEARVAKPDPAMFLMAAEAMRAAPARCLVLEDSGQGIAAAMAAGMRVLDVRTGPGLATLRALAPQKRGASA